MFNNAAISWQNHLQLLVDHSSTEIEYIAASEATRKVTFHLRLLSLELKRT
jgi:hypothetical protein